MFCIFDWQRKMGTIIIKVSFHVLREANQLANFFDKQFVLLGKKVFKWVTLGVTGKNRSGSFKLIPTLHVSILSLGPRYLTDKGHIWSKV